MKKMLSADIGWLAGIIEGEGWFVSNKSTGPQVCVAMTDFDVVERLQEVTGVGRLNERRPSYEGAKQQLQWTVGKRPEVLAICYLILPFLGERRSMKVLELLAFAENLEIAAQHRKEFFSCGHPATPDNTYVIGRDSRPGFSRACRICSAERSEVRRKQNLIKKQNSRTDVCVNPGCGVSLAGCHMNARTCSDECAYQVTLERNRQRRHEKAGT